jgi:uncharacterized protein involved in exopolysaccharide biosynthesis
MTGQAAATTLGPDIILPTTHTPFEVLRRHLRLLVLAPIAFGTLGLVATAWVPPTFTAVTTFMPPQQAQGSAAAAMASLGALAGLAGAIGGVRNSGDQYIALMQSVTLSDRMIDRFELMKVYETDYRVDARRVLASNVRISLGKRDGWITVEVDDRDRKRAADMANRYVDELRRLSDSLAVTEAQQRRTFFEQQLAQSRERLVRAQQALQASGFNPGALKAEPRAAAEAYARLKAETTTAEVRLQALRSSFTEGSAEIRQQKELLAALRGQLARSEQPTAQDNGPDYVGKFREFKYQETLFELYAKQFELARVDESREGALIQVVDAATPPEKKSKPKRALIAIAATLLSAVLLAGLLVWRDRNRPLARRLAQKRPEPVA